MYEEIKVAAIKIADDCDTNLSQPLTSALLAEASTVMAERDAMKVKLDAWAAGWAKVKADEAALDGRDELDALVP